MYKVLHYIKLLFSLMFNVKRFLNEGFSDILLFSSLVYSFFQFVAMFAFDWCFVTHRLHNMYFSFQPRPNFKELLSRNICWARSQMVHVGWYFGSAFCGNYTHTKQDKKRLSSLMKLGWRKPRVQHQSCGILI